MTPRFKNMALALAAIAGVAAAPVLSVAASSGIASAYGCKLNEADAHPCIVLGMNIGELLYSLFVLGWLMLVTLPLGAIALLIWCIVALMFWSRSKPTTPTAV